MKFAFTAEFDKIEDLVDFYNKVRTDLPELSGHTTITPEPETFVSLADPKPEEQFPAPETVQAVEDLNNDLQKAKDAIPDKRVFNRGEVKAFCAKARTEKGVNIKQILLSLGATGFSALPDEKLGALYDAVKSACGD